MENNYEVRETVGIDTGVEYLTPSDLVRSDDEKVYAEFNNWSNFGNGPTHPA